LKKTLFSVSIIFITTFFYQKLNTEIPDNIPERNRETIEIDKIETRIQQIKNNKIKLLKIDNKKIKRGRDLSRNSITNREKIKAVNSNFYRQKKAISNMIDRIEREKIHEK
jgi:low affinity Fe/Cu permease